MTLPRGLIRTQKVTPIKKQRSKESRRAMIPAESILWQRLRNGKLEGLKFRRQQIIEGFIADFYCQSLGLVVEVDGLVREKQQDYDIARDKILETKNIKVLRFTNNDIAYNLENVLQAICCARN